MNDNIIVSLTSHGERIEHCTKTIFSIIKGSIKTKIVLTVYENDLHKVYCSDNLRCFIDNGIIELIVADKDFGPHLKYFYTMKKYPNSIIITVDDDILYEENMIKKLLFSHLKYPHDIIANRCHFIKTLDYNKWEREIKQCTRSHHNFATGVGGVLYPKGCFSLSKENEREILDIKFADDIYLKLLELRNNRIVLNLHNLNFKTLYDNVFEQTALYKMNLNNNRNNVYLRKFANEFKQLL